VNDLSFADFFHAIHEMPPLPWQSDLAARLTESHQWPALIDLPTASGKTACIDIAVFHLAWCAQKGEPWHAARRIVFVVDRRIIVDAAHDRARKIADALEHPQLPATRSVAAALTKIADGGVPLICQKLRGGMHRERGFRHDPSQPMVISSTVDQIGSRLLFRGYGLSAYSFPVHAGLFGHDTLILLDEAHLSVPFTETVTAIRREQARAECLLSPVQPVKLVALSATAQSSGDRYTLSDQDLCNPHIQARRTAPKPALLISASSKPTERLKSLLQQTLAVYKAIPSSAPAVAVIANRVKTARALFTALCNEASGHFDVHLMIGRSRPLDRDRLAKNVLERVRAGREDLSTDRGVIVVATQTIEVGADLDFQGLVSECASLDALRQRFGRLDRLGKFQQARAVIVGGNDAEDDPIYGEALNKTWNWLNSIATAGDEGPIVDFCVAAMEPALATANIRELNMGPGKALQLTPNLVDLLCQTAPRPQYDPDLSALLHGFGTALPDVQVIWREAVPVVTQRKQVQIDEQEGHLTNALLALLPPSSLEIMALPLSSVKSWLSQTALPECLTDVEGAARYTEDSNGMKSPSARRVWRRNIDREDRWEATSAKELRPGDTILVPAGYGGCDRFGFAPDDNSSVHDLVMEARTELESEQINIITLQTVLNLPGRDVKELTDVWADARDAHISLELPAIELLDRLLERLGVKAPDELGWISPSATEILLRADQTLYAFVLRGGKAGVEDISDEDLSSSRTVRISLKNHNAGVGKRARDLARLLGLQPDSRATLGCAGDVHDLGKADPRFQRLLRAGEDTTDELLAKGQRRTQSSNFERGERHEAYSVAIIRLFPQLLESAVDRELAQYLVGTHHGRGRGLMPAIGDSGARFRFATNGQTIDFDGAANLGALDSDWPSLFWKLNQRYGPWGLAYLESVLRLADHLQSRDELSGKVRYE
jgi:CRISPR-associated endonuclease/helicase Cas3